MNSIKTPLTLLANAAIHPDAILEQAYKSGFCQRIGKIHPYSFWETFCTESIRGTLSYNDFAARLESQGRASISRQAVACKTSKAGQFFFERVLAMAMAAKTDLDGVEQLQAQGPFERIIVQDSTVIRLPGRLHSMFSGVKNAHSTTCNARIQGVYDILAGSFLHYSIDPYSRNDLTAAMDFLPQPGDLVLKDRGYFKPETIRTCIDQGAHCIFRYKHQVSLLSVDDGKKLDLEKLLQQVGSVDRKVLLSSEKHGPVPVRLMAFPVTQEVANLRRMKAKKESNGKNPSKKVLYLMGWSIYITTLSSEQISPRQIAKLYAVRWRIENIFKTWKSNFCFDHIHNVSAPQLRMLLLARLTMIVLLHQHVFRPLALALAKMGRELSLMKFMRYAQMNLATVMGFPSIEHRTQELLGPMLRYGVMDKRKRKSLEVALASVLEEIKAP